LPQLAEVRRLLTERAYQVLEEFPTDQRSDLASLDVPTIVIHGDVDPFAPYDLCGRPTADAIAGARTLIYEKASHGIVFTHAARLTEDLLAFSAG